MRYLMYCEHINPNKLSPSKGAVDGERPLKYSLSKFESLLKIWTGISVSSKISGGRRENGK
jgi:hypothetical protein